MGVSQKQYRIRDSQEISLRFPKDLITEQFNGKDGKTYVAVKVPNKDENDHTPWGTFIAEKNKIHQDRGDKNFVFMYLSANDRSVIRRAVVQSKDWRGRNVWGNERILTKNTDIKARIDREYGRSSVKDRLRSNEPVSRKDSNLADPPGCARKKEESL